MCRIGHEGHDDCIAMSKRAARTARRKAAKTSKKLDARQAEEAERVAKEFEKRKAQRERIEEMEREKRQAEEDMEIWRAETEAAKRGGVRKGGIELSERALRAVE